MLLCCGGVRLTSGGAGRVVVDVHMFAMFHLHRCSNGQSSLHSDKIILGPMVRVGTLPTRLLSLRNGADLVYTEEIIDFKLLKSKRFLNTELDTIDFIDDSGVVVFRTCVEERDKVILQIGTNDPTRALQAAKVVEADVAGIDINMGCPKSFSLKGGMGAALLTKPEKIENILTTLKANLKIPLSCKIRVLPDLEDTLKLVKVIEKTGVDALTIHARTKEERPQHPNRDDYIRTVVANTTIPIIANGGSSHIHCYEDIEKFRAKTNASSVMLARSAMKNFTIFNRNQPNTDVEQLIVEYLKLAIQYDNNAINSKYCIQQMLGNLQEVGRGKQLLGAYELSTMSKIYGLYDYYVDTLEERLARKNRLSQNTNEMMISADSIGLPVVFDKTLFTERTSPKSILNRWITAHKSEKPIFETYPVEKQFHSVLIISGKRYWTPYLEKTKKHSEQSAALVWLLSAGLCHDQRVIDLCLVSERNVVPALQYHHNGSRYLIKVNK